MLHATAYPSRGRRQRNGCDAPSKLLSAPVFVQDDGGTFTPLPQQETPQWQETGFAESVACAAVHYAGQPYYPENPQSSRVELAVPWDTATALVHLLSAILVARLTGPTPSCNQEQVEAARLLNRLSADVAATTRSPPSNVV